MKKRRNQKEEKRRQKIEDQRRIQKEIEDENGFE